MKVNKKCPNCSRTHLEIIKTEHKTYRLICKNCQYFSKDFKTQGEAIKTEDY